MKNPITNQKGEILTTWLILCLCVVALSGLIQIAKNSGKEQETRKDSVAESSLKFQTRCELVDMRNTEAMNQILAKYDGWRVLRISEYTTLDKSGTSGKICFERRIIPENVPPPAAKIIAPPIAPLSSGPVQTGFTGQIEKLRK